MGAPEGTVAYAYATALRKALDGYLTGGGTQTKLARALSTSKASVTRYLNGDRIAPRRQLPAIKAFLEGQGFPCPVEVWAELDELCGRAHLASGAAAVQRDHLKEELARACGEHQRAQWIAEKQLHGLQQRADRLAEDLRQALARAQRAERTRRILQERVTVQDQSLRKAGDFVRGIEDELAQQKKQSGLLGTENGVLREQNRRLLEEKPPVAAPATQLSHVPTPHYIYIPVPGLAVETGTATADVTGAASSPQRQVLPQELPSAGPAELYGTTPFHEEDQYGYEAYGSGYWTPDPPTYDALFAYDVAGTQPASYYYQGNATTYPYSQHDAYSYQAWAAAPCDTGTYDARGYGEWASSPLPAPVDGEPSLHAPATPPAPLLHQDDENAQQPAPAARPNRTAPPRGRAGALSALALLAVLVGSRVL
ncbi:hypothetical protein Snoj_01020 [Streptomyces nojiriensis]|uniref:Helix-turn-helix domain-containing protein n=1 Tax=Streptomyces nojiriensis TaxID=66374 RepID=A0ABQ3SDI0_9ACTN|nr:hypothetical protein [Streptomyces nojiriensis]GGS34457.1 hypothetical protein GCM10010205_75770 [Streptomyces nojiriensis]GHI66184.1 hypothetical protein Snoj_01020 [Streptomyces nojiriensis]